MYKEINFYKLNTHVKPTSRANITTIVESQTNLFKFIFPSLLNFQS